MKKLLIIIPFLFIAIDSMGQSKYIGIQAGVNLSNLIPFSNITRTTYPIMGFTGGLKYEKQYSSKHSFGVDLLYNQQGYATDTPAGYIGYNDYTKYKYHYLSLPIKYGYIFGDQVKFIPKIGIQPSILLSAVEFGPVYSEPTRRFVEGSKDITDETEVFNIGGVIEFEINVPHNNLEYFALFSNRFHFTYPSGFVDFSFSLGVKYNISTATDITY